MLEPHARREFRRERPQFPRMGSRLVGGLVVGIGGHRKLVYGGSRNQDPVIVRFGGGLEPAIAGLAVRFGPGDQQVGRDGDFLPFA